MEPYRFPHGADVRIMLEAVGVDADALSGIAVTADLKRAQLGRPPDDSAPVVASFMAAPIAATADVGPGWILTIEAAAALEVGTYVTNARLIFPGGGVDKSDPLLIRIEAAV